MNWVSVKESLPTNGQGIPYMSFMTKAVLMRGTWREDYPIVGHFILQTYNEKVGCNRQIEFEHPDGYEFYSARCAYIPDLANLAPAFKGLLPVALTNAVTHWCEIPEVLAADNGAESQPNAELEHRWVGPTGPIKWEHCAVCGIIRRRDRKNSTSCKGPSRVTTRAADNGTAGP